MKILVLGSSGLIGSTIYMYLSKKKLLTYGTYNNNKPNFKNIIKFNYLQDSIDFFFNFDLIINCIGLTKHMQNINNLNETYFLNIQLPLKLSQFSQIHKKKIIHISSDCVFNGIKGNFKEYDKDLADDIYGQSKYISELILKKSLIIRTSTIGHEIISKNGLLEWFLTQDNIIEGYKNAFFNGLTTLELSKIIYKYFICKNYFPKILINISSSKISKYDLLNHISLIYKKKIKIEENYQYKIDRTLNNSKFLKLTDYKIKSWYTMIKESKDFYEECLKIKL